MVLLASGAGKGAQECVASTYEMKAPPKPYTLNPKP